MRRLRTGERWLISLIPGLLLLPIISTVPAQAAAATPTITVVAGNGVNGPLEDNVPAIATPLSGPSDVAALPGGSLAIADTYNHEIRSLPGDGTIQHLLGTGVAGCDPAGGSVVEQPRGLATDAAGDVFVSNTLCQLVEKIASDGTVTVVAGRFDSDATYTPVITDGMPATKAFLSQPAGLDYDDATGTLYIADQYSSRILAVKDGAISVVAGSANNGFSGDGGPATSAELNYPRDVLFHAGKLYIADSSNSRVRVVAGGTINTLIGTGGSSDAGDGGPVQDASLSGASGLAFDPAGDLYIASSRSGAIREVDGFGNVSTPAQLTGGLGGITFDRDGNLIVAESVTPQEVVKISGLNPPAPVVQPTLASMSVASPQVSDPDFTRGLYLLPLDNGAKIDHFEYGWTADPAATKPDTTLQTSRDLTGRLDYREAGPNADWYLIGRAVGPDGVAGPWSSPLKVRTPPVPVMPVLGDSIASGHNVPDAKSATKCEDPSYGYPAEYFKRWQASMPPQWRSASSYQNFAYSGFSVVPHGRRNELGSIILGGKDPCDSKTIHPVPLTDAENQLKAHPGSWNRVIGTMGIDDTNWNNVILAVAVGSAVIKDHPLTAAACSLLVRGSWSGYDKLLQTGITNGVKQVTSTLRVTDPAVKFEIQGYYNIAGTGPIPLSCSAALTNAMATIHGVVQAGLPADAQFNDISSVMNSQGSLMQVLINGKITTNIVQLTGWPHPNKSGAVAIAAKMPL